MPTVNSSLHLNKRSSLFHRQDFLQLFPKLHAGPVQAAAHRAQGQVQDFGDGLVTTTIHLPQHEHHAVLFGQLRNGVPHLAAAFLAFQLLAGAVGRA